jgi:hypothetical protein
MLKMVQTLTTNAEKFLTQTFKPFIKLIALNLDSKVLERQYSSTAGYLIISAALPCIS